MRVLRIACAAALLMGGGTAFAEPASAQRFTSVQTAKGHHEPARKRVSSVIHAGFGIHGHRGLKRTRVDKQTRRHNPKTHDHGRWSNVHVVRAGIHNTHGSKRARKHGRKPARSHQFKHFAAFSLPDQHLYPPYYRSKRPHPGQTVLHSHIEGGLTVRQGSPWRGAIKGGRTVEGGSPWRGHIAGGHTIKQGSRWAGHIKGGATVRQGSRWSSHRANWRFSGYRAPMRPKGLAYFNARPRHVATAGRHHFPKAKLPRRPKTHYRGPVVRGPTFKRVTYGGRHRR